MRLGLSQRGWNNVLIFASLFMIVLFNVTHQKFIANGESDTMTTLISPNSIIQSIDYSGLKFERLGAGWRTVSELPIDDTSANDFAQAWRSLLVKPLMSSPDTRQVDLNFPIAIYTTGSDQIWVFEILTTNDSAYIQNKNSGQWHQITANDLSKLVPSFLIQGK